MTFTSCCRCASIRNHVRLRPRIASPTAGDAPALRALVHAAVAPSYDVAVDEALEAALAAAGADARTLVAHMDDTAAGCIVFGAIAGAERAARLRLIAVASNRRRAGIALALVQAAVAMLFDAGARFVIVEIADEAALAPCAALLTRAGFVEIARVADLVRDGVAMRYLQLLPPR